MALCDLLPLGPYLLTNAKGGTALDVAPWVRSRIEAHGIHFGNNQKWDFINTGDGWAIRSRNGSEDGRPVYISVTGQLREGCEAVHSTVPMSWDVKLVDDALRISWPRTNYVVALGDNGSPRAGTQVQLMRLQPGMLCQIWHFTRCSVLKPSTSTPAVHVFVHMDEDVALHLDSASRKWIQHRPLHKEHNQRWKFVTNGGEEVIQAIRGSLDGQPLYLNVQGPAQVGALVIASPYPVGWHVERSQSRDGRHTIRMFWPGTNLVISTQCSGDTLRVTLAEYDDSPSSHWARIDVAEPTPDSEAKTG